jgi:hypothetical protein
MSRGHRANKRQGEVEIRSLTKGTYRDPDGSVWSFADGRWDGRSAVDPCDWGDQTATHRFFVQRSLIEPIGRKKFLRPYARAARPWRCYEFQRDDERSLVDAEVTRQFRSAVAPPVNEDVLGRLELP